MKKFLAALGLMAGFTLVATDLMAANPASLLVRVTPVGTKDITINGSTTTNFGNVAIGGSTVSIAGIDVENSGNIAQSYRLNLDRTAGGGSTGTTWTAAAAAGADQFAFFALFNGAGQPLPASFGATDVVLDTTTDSSATVYSNGVETGVSVSPAAATDNRTLWMRLDMPTSSTSGASEEMFRVIVTAF